MKKLFFLLAFLSILSTNINAQPATVVPYPEIKWEDVKGLDWESNRLINIKNNTVDYENHVNLMFNDLFRYFRSLTSSELACGKGMCYKPIKIPVYLNFAAFESLNTSYENNIEDLNSRQEVIKEILNYMKEYYSKDFSDFSLFTGTTFGLRIKEITFRHGKPEKVVIEYYTYTCIPCELSH
jgi:hypothetical protein